MSTQELIEKITDADLRGYAVEFEAVEERGKEVEYCSAYSDCDYSAKKVIIRLQRA